MPDTRVASLTHVGPDRLSKADIAQELQSIRERLEKEFKDSPGEKGKLLQTLDALSEFELGRFLIKNKSLSGYWTWYIILGFNNGLITSPVERFLIEKTPTVLATRQRFHLFQSLLTQHIASNSVVCSVPCGMMADLLTLKLPGEVKEVRFVGIDLDAMVFGLAKDLAKQHNVRTPCEFFQRDAWNLGVKEEFDVVTTSGLSIYVEDDRKVVALYRGIWNALKDQGRLICSAITPPPTPAAVKSDCEWNMAKINQDDLKASMAIFKTIIGATWSNFRSSAKTCEQLREAGFDNIEIHWDEQKMFPTFLAQKQRLQSKLSA